MVILSRLPAPVNRECDRPARGVRLHFAGEMLPGGFVPNPSELLGGQRFTDLLGQLKKTYDRILIDSPPIGVVTDAQILAANCDLTLLVLRASQSSRLLAQRAMGALLTVGARLIGAVVNDVPRRDHRYSVPGSSYGGYPPNGHERDDAGLPADIRWEVLNAGVSPLDDKPQRPRGNGRARTRKTSRRKTATDDKEK